MFMILKNIMNMEDRVPIYTVHDNFITTVLFTKVVPNAYIKTIAEGRNPLFYINHYIINNLVKDYFQKKKINEDYNLILDTSFISDILRKRLPSSLNKKMKDKKIQCFIDAYENYVKTVCKNDDVSISAYLDNLDRFKHEMYK